MLITKILGVPLEQELIKVGIISEYYESVREGDVFYRLMLAKLQVLRILSQANVEPRGVRAILATYENEAVPQYVIASLYAVLDQSLIDSCIYRIEGPDEAADTMEELASFFDDLGIAGTQIVEDAYPVVLCECCSEPMVFVDNLDEDTIQNGTRIPFGHTHVTSRTTRFH